MPSAFKLGSDGTPYVLADPGSDLDYSVTSWLEGLAFIDVDWSVEPALAGGSVYGDSLNAAPVIIDGVEYAIGYVASVFIKNMVAGQTYSVKASATFEGSRKDERTFLIQCVER
jgi:hypothetical protein